MFDMFTIKITLTSFTLAAAFCVAMANLSSLALAQLPSTPSCFGVVLKGMNGCAGGIRMICPGALARPALFPQDLECLPSNRWTAPSHLPQPGRV
jgi:hypothetical protein